MFENIESNSSNSKTKNLNPNENIGEKEESLLQILKTFWTLPNIVEFCKIVLRVSVKYTLSTLDSLLLNYTKTHNIKYQIDGKDGKEMLFDLNASHQEMLDTFGRIYWSVFGRYRKIIIEFRSKELEKVLVPSENEVSEGAVQWSAKFFVGTRKVNGKIYFYLMTTVGQLNLFAWAINRKVLDYCAENQHLIDGQKPKSSGSSRKKKSVEPEFP
jgi:hypothetical protein